MAWFHTIAHNIDLVVRPAFAMLTLILNLLLTWIWPLVRLVAGAISNDPRSTIRRAPAPTLQPGSPAATALCVAVVLTVASSVAGPFVWPAQSNPRSFGYASAGWAASPSDPVKAVNVMQQMIDAVGGFINQPQAPPVAAPEAPLAQRAPGDHDVRGAPTVSAAQIDRILASYNSPASGSGAAWVAMGEKYGIDPAYAVAFFIHESSAGTNPGWAGIKADGSTTHNVGNIICAGYPTCYGRFRDYPSWEAGINDWYKLISVEYIEGRGTTTVAEILPIYAPSFENDTQGYIRIVEQMVDGWRSGGV